jgi:hypothetical protein
MKVKGMVAGLGIAGLLIALPAGAQSTTGGSGTGSGTSSSGQPGSMGSGSAVGSMDSSGSMGMHGSASSPGSSQVTGKVDKLDRTSNQLSLRLNVSDSTQVMKNGQPATLSDIKEGDQVRASFSPSGQVDRLDVVSSGSSTGSSGSSSPGGSSGGAMGGPSGAGSPGSSGTSGSGRGY